MSKSYVILTNNVVDKQDPILCYSPSSEPYPFFMFKSSGFLYLRRYYAPAFILAHFFGGGYRSRTDDPLRARQVL